MTKKDLKFQGPLGRPLLIRRLRAFLIIVLATTRKSVIVLALFIFISTLLIFIFLLLYMVKSLIGIDLFSDQHLLDFLDFLDD
jgi:hypothetical protein